MLMKGFKKMNDADAFLYCKKEVNWVENQC